MKVRPALFETKEQAKFGDIILSTRNRLHKTLAIKSINKKQLIVLIQLDSVLNDTDIKEGELYYFLFLITVGHQVSQWLIKMI